MELSELQRKLLAAGRSAPTNEQVPYAFEKRISTCIQTCPAPEYSGHWVRALWTAAGACATLTLLLVSWLFFAPGNSSSSRDFSEDLENTVLAALDSDSSAESLW